MDKKSLSVHSCGAVYCAVPDGRNPKVTVRMKATEQHFRVVMFVFNALQTFIFLGGIFFNLKEQNVPGARFSKVPLTFRARKAILCAQCLH